MAGAVSIEREGGIATVTLGHGGEDNRLDEQVWEGLRRAALQLSDAPPRAVVVTGGTNFSCGLDLSPVNGIVQRLEALARGRDLSVTTEYLAGLRTAVTSLGRIPCPVIAAIEGDCMGPGLEIALACDLRVASRTSRFRLDQVRMGLVPSNGGIVQLRRLLGSARAADLVLTCRTLDADAALAWGLLARTAPAGGALAEAHALADTIVQSSRGAVLQAILALRQLSGSSDEYQVETQAAARGISSGDLTEGLLAALHDRPPRWKA